MIRLTGNRYGEPSRIERIRRRRLFAQLRVQLRQMLKHYSPLQVMHHRTKRDTTLAFK